MATETIFEKFVKDEEEFYKVYEDKYLLVFLDIDPISKGHALIIPKKKFKTIFEASPIYLKEIILRAQKVAKLLKKKYKYPTITIYHTSGGKHQDIKYLHFHVFGRHSKQEVKFSNPIEFKGEFDKKKMLIKISKELQKSI